LRTNDEVIAINGQKIFNYQAVFEVEQSFSNSPVRPVVFTIQRGGEQFDVTLEAEKPVQPKDATPSFGIWFLADFDETLVYPKPFDQIRESAGQIFATVATVMSRKSDVGVQQLGGPVMIIRAYRTFLDSENGWRRVLWFSVILNVNLALFNLLPFPVLDGGHITLALVESIRRRSVSARFLNFLQTACAMLLIGFMLFIAFFDIGDWIRSGGKSRSEAVKVFAPRQ
jgi:regulator of sigma E protease